MRGKLLKKFIRKRGLAFQFWIVMASLLLGVFIFLALYFNISMNNFFTEETYKTIEMGQSTFLFSRGKTGPIQKITGDNLYYFKDMRAVNHLVVVDENIDSLKKVFKLENSGDFVRIIERQVETQKLETQRYEYKLSKSRIYYVIKKVQIDDKNAYLMSFMFDTYRNRLVKYVVTKLLVGGGIAVLISILVAILFSKYLTSPLKLLEYRVKRIAKQDWFEPLNVQRGDEIGSLADSIEYMRQRLVERDESKQNMLQQISHELKTPIMVIKSYTEAIKDGIYPKGDLYGTLEVIDHETSRMDKKVRELLYLTKLDYIWSKRRIITKFEINLLIDEIIDRLKLTNSYINWIYNSSTAIIEGDMEQWAVVIENLLDNALRYAKKHIQIDIIKHNSLIDIRIFNDGMPINDEDIPNIFKPFNKGKNGKYGLGLSIVEEIVKDHKARIYAQNVNNGVVFYIEGLIEVKK